MSAEDDDTLRELSAKLRLSRAHTIRLALLEMRDRMAREESQPLVRQVAQ